MRVSLVVAAARNNVIGLGGKIPWRLPDDQAFFKKLTVGHCIVMGRKTFESLPRPLPNRKTLVLSRQAHEPVGDVEYWTSLTAALDRARSENFAECFIAGGEAIYHEGLSIADRIYLTRIDVSPDGDTHFPAIDEAKWKCFERKSHPIDGRHALSFAFETWERIE